MPRALDRAAHVAVVEEDVGALGARGQIADSLEPFGELLGGVLPVVALVAPAPPGGGVAAVEPHVAGVGGGGGHRAGMSPGSAGSSTAQ